MGANPSWCSQVPPAMSLPKPVAPRQGFGGMDGSGQTQFRRATGRQKSSKGIRAFSKQLECFAFNRENTPGHIHPTLSDPSLPIAAATTDWELGPILDSI